MTAKTYCLVDMHRAWAAEPYLEWSHDDSQKYLLEGIQLAIALYGSALNWTYTQLNCDVTIEFAKINDTLIGLLDQNRIVLKEDSCWSSRYTLCDYANYPLDFIVIITLLCGTTCCFFSLLLLCEAKRSLGMALYLASAVALLSAIFTKMVMYACSNCHMLPHVLAHEIGHFLGMQHDTEFNSLMKPELQKGDRACLTYNHTVFVELHHGLRSAPGCLTFQPVRRSLGINHLMLGLLLTVVLPLSVGVCCRLKHKGRICERSAVEYR